MFSTLKNVQTRCKWKIEIMLSGKNLFKNTILVTLTLTNVVSFAPTSALAGQANCKQLIEKISDGNLKAAEKIIKKGVSPSCIHYEPGVGHFFPLQIAVLRKNKSAIDFLLQAGADLETRDPGYYTTALHHAAGLNRDSLEFVKYLVSKGSRIDSSAEIARTPLYIAVDFNNPDSVEFLLSNGANPNARNNVMSDGPTLHAAYLGQISTLDTLIRAGGKLNLPKMSGTQVSDAFTIATVNCKKEMLEHLLSRYSSETNADNMGQSLGVLGRCGAHYGNKSFPGKISNPDLVPLAITFVTQGADYKKYGASALVAASTMMRLDLIQYLLSLGVDINAASSGKNTNALNTALTSLSTPGFSQFATELVQLGANPNTVNDRGESALHRAVYTVSTYERTAERLGLIRTLLERGADKNATYNGKTPLEVIRSERNIWREAEALF